MLCFYISICGGISYGIFFFKQKTAYEMRISDWSSDVCSSDLVHLRDDRKGTAWTSKVESFRLARHLTTRALLHGDSSDDSSKPAVNLSWKDAIATCNALSVADGLTPAYRDVDTDSPQWDRGATGYRLATEAEWQYACKAGTSG